MANTLKLAATTTSGHTPDGLQLGELAVNTTNKKVWVGTNGNTSGNVLLYDQATAYTNTTYSEGDHGLTQANFTDTLRTKLNGIAASATNTAAPHYTSAIAVGDGGLTQKNFTTTLKSKLDGIATGATNTAAPHYTSAIAVGAGGLTQQNFTTTLKNKLDAIEAGATADQDLSAYVTNTELSNELDALVDAAPGALDTLNELAASIGDDASYATTVTNALAGKSSTSHTHSVTAGQFSQQNFTTTLKNKLDGIAASANNYSFPYSITSASTAGTVAYRDSSGDLTARLFRSEYDTVATASSIGYINVQYNTAADNYIRPATAASVRTFLNVANGATNTAAPFYTSPIAVTDGGLTQKNFTTTLKNKLDGIAASATNTAAPYYTSAIAVGAGGLTQQNFTTTLKSKLDGIAASATNTPDWTASGAGTIHAHNYTNTTYAEGDHGLTQANFTDTLRTKLNGIAASANNYSFPYTVSASESASTVVQRNGSGYLHASYFNGSGTFSTTGAASGMARFTGTNGSDTYGRCYNATAARLLLNVADGATNTAAPYYTSAIAVGAGGLTQQNFTTTLKNKLDGIAAGATNTAAPYYTSAIASTSLTNWAASSAGTIHSSNYTNTTYSVGAGGLTQQNFTTTLKSKLDGIAAGATNTAAPYYTSAIASTSLTNWAASSAGTIHSSNYTNTTYAEGDHGLTQANFTDTLRTKLNGIATGATNTAAPFYTSAIAVGAGGLTQQNFTTTLKNKLDGIAASATNTAAPFYTSAIAVGAGGLTQQNFTTTLKNKLDGIAAGATVGITSSVTTLGSLSSASSLFGGASSGVTHQGLSRDVAYKIMNNVSTSVCCVTTTGGSSTEYLRYASGGNFSWDTIEWNHIQNVSALSALP